MSIRMSGSWHKNSMLAIPMGQHTIPCVSPAIALFIREYIGGVLLGQCGTLLKIYTIVEKHYSIHNAVS